MNVNILEEYLVKIGAEVDQNAFKGAANAIKKLSGLLKGLDSFLTRAAIPAALGAITAAVAQNIKAVAALDLEYQKLAKNMWVTKETAKSLKLAMDIMGASEDDIAWVPELREQFFRLRSEMQALATPQDADSQLRWIRDIGYDIQSLQLKLKMFREWLVYYLIKYLQPYIQDFRDFINWLNNKLGNNMPELARKLAFWLSKAVSLLAAGGRAIAFVFGKVYEFVDALPAKTKALIAVFAAAGALIIASPFGMLIASIGATLVMLEDFFAFLDGRKSSRTLAPMWAALLKFGQSDIFKTAQDGLQGLFDILARITGEIKFSEWLNESVKAIELVLKRITELSDTLVGFARKLDVSGFKTDNFFERVGKAISASLMNIPALINVLAKLFSAVDKALQGNWGGAFGELTGAVNDLVNAKTEEFKAQKNIWFPDDKDRRKLLIPDDIWDEGLKKTNKDLIAALERINAKVYAEFGKSLEVTGGFRTPSQNASVGGVANSKHLTGYAVDLDSEMWSEDERAKIDAWAQEEGLYTLRHNAGTGDHWHFQMNQDEKHGGSGGSYALAPTSYAANMAALPSSYAASMIPSRASGSAMSFSIGAINVTVTNSNASAQEIASAVGSEFKNNVAGYLAANGTGVTFI